MDQLGGNEADVQQNQISGSQHTCRLAEKLIPLIDGRLDSQENQGQVAQSAHRTEQNTDQGQGPVKRAIRVK